MNPEARPDIQAMHAAYCAASGMQLSLDWAREIQWYEVWRRGIRAPDIREVIRWMQWRKSKDLPVRSLLFRKFVGDADFLEEDIAMMRANQRARSAAAPTQTDRGSVLRSSGRDAAPAPPPGRTAEVVLKSAISDPVLYDAMEELKRQIKEDRL